MNDTEKRTKKQAHEEYLDLLTILGTVNFLLKEPQDLIDNVELVYGVKLLISQLYENVDFDLITSIENE